MHKKQVAIIDIGSSEIRALVGEKGVNNTFIIKGKTAFSYEGFAEGVFFDVNALRNILLSCGDYLKKVARGDVSTVYVGVPGAFTEVVVKSSQISFAKEKKITSIDVDNLFDAAFVGNSSKKTLINRSAIMYELNDMRRMANPIGVQSEILKGKLSFILCDNYFMECVKPALNTAGFTSIEFVSTALAEAMFLFDTESRDRISILVDVGYISTTFSLIQGDGIVYQRSFDYGGGYITASILERFNMEFEHAETVKRKTNLSHITTGSAFEVIDGENGHYYNTEEVKKTICASLDGFCDEISICMEQIPFIVPEYVSIKITGGGLAFIRGAKEYIASRMSLPFEVIAPQVPLMDNPLESSTLSLLSIALEQ